MSVVVVDVIVMDIVKVSVDEASRQYKAAPTAVSR